MRISLFHGLIFFISTFYLPGTLYAQTANSIEIKALFNNKAMIEINNDTHLLEVNGPVIQGVKLIEATSKYAILEVEGKRSKYSLGNRVQSSYQQKTKKKVLLYRNSFGMFKTTGSINGFTVDFLVDTGASAIAMSSKTAKRIGIQYQLRGTQTTVETASGITAAFVVNLSEVRVGEIELKNVRGIIIEGSEPSTPLLGMSFLSRINIVNEGQIMTLEEKY